MDIKLIPQINGPASLDSLKGNAQVAGRICYSDKDIETLFDEEYNVELVEKRLLKCGHHSPFEHKHLTFYMNNIPKILAMVLNNERPYVTSEKSARYTVMKNMVPEQERLYNKWLSIFEEEIQLVYPEKNFPKLYARDKSGKNSITKLSQENARYMTSVFTPTKMVHTIDARQLNFINSEFEKYISEKKGSKNEFEQRLSPVMAEFLEKTREFQIENLKNQTDRHLSLFRETKVEEYFGDVYAVNYPLSLAGLAQAQRHRTLDYTMQTPRRGAYEGFFIPGIIKEMKCEKEWLEDLYSVSDKDFPQAQLVSVTERGKLEDFRSKCVLRLCSHAQWEIMQNMLVTADKYSKYREEIKEWIKPKCKQNIKCAEPCIIGNELALKRIL